MIDPNVLSNETLHDLVIGLRADQSRLQRAGHVFDAEEIVQAIILVEGILRTRGAPIPAPRKN
jgi:hypothetical protein